jgi:hypothetical protein
MSQMAKAFQKAEGSLCTSEATLQMRFSNLKNYSHQRPNHFRSTLASEALITKEQYSQIKIFLDIPQPYR